MKKLLLLTLFLPLLTFADASVIKIYSKTFSMGGPTAIFKMTDENNICYIDYNGSAADTISCVKGN